VYNTKRLRTFLKSLVKQGFVFCPSVSGFLRIFTKAIPQPWSASWSSRNEFDHFFQIIFLFLFFFREKYFPFKKRQKKATKYFLSLFFVAPNSLTIFVNG